MIKLPDEYSFERILVDSTGGNFKYENSNLKVWKNNRYYNTKKQLSDLPESYCAIHRYSNKYDVCETKGITDMQYTWIKENHFMKDSMLRVSYQGKIVEKPMMFEHKGKLVETCFKDYENVNVVVFGNDIFKFLRYAKKWSNYDLTDIRNEFVKQCEWLKENEPIFAPDTNNFGHWFDLQTTDIKIS